LQLLESPEKSVRPWPAVCSPRISLFELYSEIAPRVRRGRDWAAISPSPTWKAWDIASAKNGLMQSYLQPLDRAVPMISTEDVGRAAAALLQEGWEGKRVVELESAQRVSPNALAGAFAKVLGTPVRAEAVPRDQWESVFRAQGMKNPTPRMQMIDGFNAGWIDFPDRGAHARKGSIDINQAIATLIQRERA